MGHADVRRGSSRVALLATVVAGLCLSTSLPCFAADTTAPTTPAVTDDGTYTTSVSQLHATWTSSDPESGIAEYQYQITRDLTTGTVIVAWTTTGTTASVTKTGLTLSSSVTYYFSVKAKNGDGLWSAVGYSNGIKVDTSAPSLPSSVTDDGVYTPSTTQLHATWTTSTDSQSGIAEYQYQIKRDSTTGTVVVAWTSTGTTTSVTKSGLTLINGINYFFGVRAKNGAGLYSGTRYSNGIRVDTTPPTGTVTINSGATFATMTAVTLQLAATDTIGTVSQMQFSNDGVTYSAAETYAITKSWTLPAGDGTKTVWVKFKDAAGNWSAAASDTIILDMVAPQLSITSPANGAIITLP